MSLITDLREALDGAVRYFSGGPDEWLVEKPVMDAARSWLDFLENGADYEAAQKRLDRLLAYFDPDMRVGDIRHIEVTPIITDAMARYKGKP